MLKAKNCFADPSWHRVEPDCYYYTVSTLKLSFFRFRRTHFFYRYQAQVTLLTSLLRPKYGLGLEIGTVDGMQGREKEAVVISLVRSNNTVRSSFFSFSPCVFFSALWFDILERSRIPKRKEKNEWYVLCVCAYRRDFKLILCLGSYLFLLLYSGYDTGKTASCEFFFSLVVIYFSLLVDFWSKSFFSVLLEILQPSAMGVNISRNGWLGWKPMLTSSMQDWNEVHT